MLSIPSVTIQPNTSNNGMISSVYTPIIYPSSTVIGASALTPSSMVPISLVPTVASLTNFSAIATHPLVNTLIPSVVTYPDVNSNKNLTSEITEYFFEKLVNNWLKYQYIELYHMLQVNSDKVYLIKSLDQIATNNKSDPKENALKYQFLLINYFAKSDVQKLLNKFRKQKGVNWWDIKHMSDDVKKYIQHKVGKYIQKQITELQLAQK
jgi:hypothetical protein